VHGCTQRGAGANDGLGSLLEEQLYRLALGLGFFGTCTACAPNVSLPYNTETFQCAELPPVHPTLAARHRQLRKPGLAPSWTIQEQLAQPFPGTEGKDVAAFLGTNREVGLSVWYFRPLAWDWAKQCLTSAAQPSSSSVLK
jgi:hypothetical protein